MTSTPAAPNLEIYTLAAAHSARLFAAGLDGSAASPGAWAVLSVALLGEGHITADDLARFDADNHAAALALLSASRRLGCWDVPAREGMRERVAKHYARLGRGGDE